MLFVTLSNMAKEKIKVPERLSDTYVTVQQQTYSYITAALSVVAGLAWNDAVQSLIKQAFPLSGDSLVAKFVYAVAITVIVVLLTLVIKRILVREEQKAKE